MEERLQKYLSQSGISSRREAEEMIKRGEVKVNGVVITELGYKVNSEDIIEVLGERITKQENKVYYMLNKPTGYISSTKDENGRKTIISLMKYVDQRIYPVGRLDYDTSGLILLTNDSSFKEMIESPTIGIEKEYHVKVDGLLRKIESKRLEKGIDLGDYKTKPAKILNVKYNDELTSTTLDIIIKEGKNREVRNLFSSVNHKVKSLKRTRIGNLRLDVPNGTYRPLKPHEVKLLKLLALGKIKK
ncbi:rRNA pseudouridine synthase [bacterium]|nr:rRNA pseudouridine synthase [bacterium]